jgi:hypothetical protein
MDSFSTVIACDKREAFAQGSVSDEAIQPSRGAMDCFAGARNDGFAHKSLGQQAACTASMPWTASITIDVDQIRARDSRNCCAHRSSAKNSLGIIGSVHRWRTTQSADQDDRGSRAPAGAPASQDGLVYRAIPEGPDLTVRAARPAHRASRGRKANAAKRVRRASPARGAKRGRAASAVRPASYRRSSR